MRKHLPTILLVIVILVNLLFMAFYIRKNGFGLFLSNTGTVVLIFGIIIFIFFLSIDPGYGWVRSIDLTRNYIMIFAAIAVSSLGVVLIISGQHVHDLTILAEKRNNRCKEIVSGNAEKVLREEWYDLRDSQNKDLLHAYLFQKKSNRNNYKILVSINTRQTHFIITNLAIASPSISGSQTAGRDEAICPGVMEQDIDIDYTTHQKLNEQVDFELVVHLLRSEASEGISTRSEERKVHLKLFNKGKDVQPSQASRLTPYNFFSRIAWI